MIRLTSFARNRAFSSRRTRREPPCSYISSSSATTNPADGSADDADDDATPNISPINTSLALSVHFRHPDFGMKDYEILSRGTAFLLQVDPPDPIEEGDELRRERHELTTATISSSSSHHSQKHVQMSAFPHLQENAATRKKLLQRQDYKYDPASGPPRLPHQLNWLEFCPTAFRPRVHVVASSHVVGPWLWPKYYPHDWLRSVTTDHVRYSLEVWGQRSDESENSSYNEEEYLVRHDGRLRGTYRPLAKFALNPYPIHHPKEIDVAVIHLKQEEAALKHLTELGIQPLHLPTMNDLETSTDPVFDPGERVLFQGFEVYEANTVDVKTLHSRNGATSKSKNASHDDERMFHPYSSLGILAWASPDQFLARTGAGVIPEGLCGGPVIHLTKDVVAKGSNRSLRDARTLLNIRGIVQGVVPAKHENRELAGLASFHPSYRVREFVDFAERIMLEHIVGPDLFRRVVDLKERKGEQNGTMYERRKDGEMRELDIGESKTRHDEKKDAEGADEKDNDDQVNDLDLLMGMEGTSEDSETPHIDREYRRIVASLRKNHTPEEVDAILATIEREKKEVIRIMEKQGGDMDDVIKAVRRRTYEEKDQILREVEREMMTTGRWKKNVEEGEINPADNGKKP